MAFFTTQRKEIAKLVESRVCDLFWTDRKELLSKVRPENVTRARQMVWWILRNHCGLSFPQLAKHYGKDHSTVLKGVQSFERAPEFAEWTTQMKRIVESPEIAPEIARLSTYPQE